jgi:predicted amidohydrolase YtcJ
LTLGSGSDSTVTPLDPRIAIHALLNHSQPAQRLDLTTALQMSTINNAFLAFEENDKGTLEPGKLADLTILSADPYHVDPTELKDIPIRTTIVGGEIVWSEGL